MTGRHRGRPAFPIPAVAVGRRRTVDDADLRTTVVTIAAAAVLVVAALAGPLFAGMTAPAAARVTTETVLPTAPEIPHTPIGGTR